MTKGPEEELFSRWYILTPDPREIRARVVMKIGKICRRGRELAIAGVLFETLIGVLLISFMIKEGRG